MTNYREILRLKFSVFNITQISQFVNCSRTIVVNNLRLAEEELLQYPLSEKSSDMVLFDTLYPAVSSKQTYKMPDLKYVHRLPDQGEGLAKKSFHSQETRLKNISNDEYRTFMH